MRITVRGSGDDGQVGCGDSEKLSGVGLAVYIDTEWTSCLTRSYINSRRQRACLFVCLFVCYLSHCQRHCLLRFFFFQTLMFNSIQCLCYAVRLYCSCVYFCLYDPFNRISLHKLSRQLSAFSFCSPGLISVLLVLSTTSLFMKVSLSSDIILCG